jgi:hypothetical protein
MVELFLHFQSQEVCGKVAHLSHIFFFLVGEVFNILIKDVMHNGMIEGIVMPNGKKEKTLYQYDDDIFLTLVRDEDNINNVMRFFNKFSEPAY